MKISWAVWCWLGKIKKSHSNEMSPLIQCCTFTAVQQFGQGQNFGFGFGLGLKALVSPISAWPRAAAKETAAKRRWTSLFANFRASHCGCLMIQHQNNFIAASLPSTIILQPNSDIITFRQTQLSLTIHCYFSIVSLCSSDFCSSWEHFLSECMGSSCRHVEQICRRLFLSHWCFLSVMLTLNLPHTCKRSDDRRQLLCERQWGIKLRCFDHGYVNSPVCCQSSFGTLLIHYFIIGLGLALKAVASVSASRFWPRLTSLINSLLKSEKHV